MKKFILLALAILALALMGTQSTYADEDCCCPGGGWPDADGNC